MTETAMIDTTVLSALSEFGIMLVLSAIVVIFLIKVLSYMLDQSKKMNELAFKEVSKLQTMMKEKFKDLTTIITGDNKTSKDALLDISKTTDNILDSQQNIEHMVDNLYQQNRAYLMQMTTVTEIQRGLLKDMKHHCPAVYSRELIIQELIKRGYVTREQIDEVMDYLNEDKD